MWVQTWYLFVYSSSRHTYLMLSIIIRVLRLIRMKLAGYVARLQGDHIIIVLKGVDSSG